MDSLPTFYVHHPDGVTRDLVENGSFEIAVAGTRYPAEASLEPFYDARGARVAYVATGMSDTAAAATLLR